MATMYDVARRAGTSVGTVSRFVNGSGYVGKASRSRIRKAIDELGFVPNSAARSLTTKRTGLIGLVVSDLRNPFSAELAHAIQHAAKEHDYSLVVSATDSEDERALQVLSGLRSRQVDGLIVAHPESRAVNEELVTTVRQGTPLVLIGMRIDPPVCDRVTTDTYEGALAAVSHLIEQGHRRIGFIVGQEQIRGRRRGYVDALGAAGIELDESLIASDPLNRDGGAAAAVRFLTRPDPPTAIFAANDAAALGVLQAAYVQNVRVPDDLSVVGFDDVELAAHAVPPLTTVAQPTIDLGREAVALLFGRLNGSGPENNVEHRLPCRLIVRDSTTQAPRRQRRRQASRS
jgi:LacI family transcriptional regulator